MVENIYTNQFATKVELNSSITQTKDSITSEVSSKYATKNDLVTTQSTIKQTTDSINLEVNKKVNNTDYTSAQILLKINNDTSSTVIKSSKLDIDAIATFTNSKLAKAGATVINGANITTGSISCDRLSGGTINGQKITGGTISGSTITTGNYFSVNSSGIATLKNNVGFLTLGRSGKHPWISGINVNRTNGISFTTGTEYNDLGSSVGGINFDGSAMYINSDGTININHGANGQKGGAVGICDYSLSGHTFTGQGGAKMFANSNCAFQPADGYYAYVGSTSDTKNRIVTSVAGTSSLNVKENLEEINAEDVYKDIQNLKLYNYDYKYKGITDRQNDFGFIIDYVEELPTLSKYARHYNSKYYVDEDKKELAKIWDVENVDKTKEVLDVKEWDRDSYIKMSMVMIKALQNKIDTLENRIKELGSDK
jgi:predicted MPP superfamily phosphohydrolase